MKIDKVSRRTMLKGAGAVLVGSAFSTRVLANAPPPEAVTPALVDGCGEGRKGVRDEIS